MLKTKRIVLAALAALALLAAMFIATPVQATVPSLKAYPSTGNWNLCPSKNTSGVTIMGCLYQDADGRGTYFMMGTDTGCRNMTGMLNTVSSVILQSWEDVVVTLYAGSNCSGADSTLWPGERFNLPAGCCSSLPNDDMESWKITTTGVGGEIITS